MIRPSLILGHLLYLAVLALLVLAIPPGALGHVSDGLIVVGVVGAWRYGWALVNYLRAVLYLRVAYPRLKARAFAAHAALPVQGHAYFLITSYKIDSDTTRRVYQALFRAAAVAPGGATIVASVVDTSDLRLIRRIHALMDVPMDGVNLVIDQIPGTGKRDALARSLRLIGRQAPSRRDILLLVDGDSCVPEDIVAASAPFFTDPEVGALTTDEAVEIKPSLFGDWFALRFTQRQMMMSSMGLSGRVLTLTGRMSVFRADLATQPEFIRLVQHDHIDHWRLGRVDFLTGDDKSTWFWLLQRGYKMLYLPDVTSLSMETQPKPGFADSAVTLMIRWFGNMLRTNGRALALGPRQIGLFTWWSILDQKVGIWTTLAGPISVLLAAIFVEPLVIPAYIAWVMATRYVFCWVLASVRGRGFPITYPVLLYFGQIVGAAVKSYVLFRLDRQRWTRQSAGPSALPALGLRLRGLGSTYVHALALGWLTFGVMLLSGLV
ncbi:glycosyltransferase [Tabrizicola aquatica]|uniref:glycosyltransferase n=1 Tax=Tabrizicola aquatica TaxID=909926 RepID=UPI001FE3FFBF|nr:glycosyltransferase [Tabrizicola aquatica]